ncbi:hypothetical protein [Nocardioides sp. LML1-1-1.1]|uniref:hypothetical protein n=1 Tax=Nocardioides sp. LML1-1-1.1 TaxID=3135248 RepID=UPI0034369CA6
MRVAGQDGAPLAGASGCRRLASEISVASLADAGGGVPVEAAERCPGRARDAQVAVAKAR